MGSMSGMSMGHDGSGHTTSIGGMSLSAAHGTTNILPDWLGQVLSARVAGMDMETQGWGVSS